MAFTRCKAVDGGLLCIKFGK